MISCYQATKLISEKMDHPISLEDKGKLLLHLLNCWQCKLFKNQMLIIAASIRELENETRVFNRLQGNYKNKLTKEIVQIAIDTKNK